MTVYVMVEDSEELKTLVKPATPENIEAAMGALRPGRVLMIEWPGNPGKFLSFSQPITASEVMAAMK